MFLLLFGLLFLGAATAIAVKAVALPRIAAAERVTQIGVYGFRREEEAAGVLGLKATLEALAGRIGEAVARRSSRFDEARLREQLMGAGLYTTSPTTFLGSRVLAAAGGFVGLPVLAAAAGSSGTFLLMASLFGAASGWLGPMLVVRRRGDRRFGQIESTLPELIDLLVVTVEAGVGLSGSIQVAAGQMPGALGEELRLSLQEQRMGLSTNQALSNMLGRCDTPSMRSFVRSVVQGESLGVSIGAIMRNLAIEMRKRRRQRAEERAQKAPIKMLFPLIFLIFPPMFIVLLYPAVNALGTSLGAG
jgi:tight adherence protein C